jgi:hypothetical protein
LNFWQSKHCKPHNNAVKSAQPGYIQTPLLLSQGQPGLPLTLLIADDEQPASHPQKAFWLEIARPWRSCALGCRNDLTHLSQIYSAKNQELD